jgi:methylmalonyl-CoA mutase cobalamin-binding subunit
VEERFLLDRIALHGADISPGHEEGATLVVTYFADSGLTIRNGTAVTAGEAAYPVAVKFFVQVPFVDVLINDFTKGRHEKPLP